MQSSNVMRGVKVLPSVLSLTFYDKYSSNIIGYFSHHSSSNRLVILLTNLKQRKTLEGINSFKNLVGEEFRSQN